MKNFVVFVLLSLAIVAPIKSEAQISVASKEVIGATSAIAIYNSFLVVGSFADMYVNEVISSDQLHSYLAEQIGMIGVVVQSYEKAIKEDSKSYSEDDVQFLNDCKAAFSLIEKEALALQKYAKSKTDEHADEYQLYREKAWNKIKVLLEIEE